MTIGIIEDQKIERLTRSTQMIRFKGGAASWFNCIPEGISRIRIWLYKYSAQGEYLGVKEVKSFDMKGDFNELVFKTRIRNELKEIKSVQHGNS